MLQGKCPVLSCASMSESDKTALKKQWKMDDANPEVNMDVFKRTDIVFDYWNYNTSGNIQHDTQHLH